MATLTSAANSAPRADTSEPGLIREIADFFRQFIVAAFDPYRPELHYMRGPGPACAAKQQDALRD